MKMIWLGLKKAHAHFNFFMFCLETFFDINLAFNNYRKLIKIKEEMGIKILLNESEFKKFKSQIILDNIHICWFFPHNTPK